MKERIGIIGLTACLALISLGWSSPAAGQEPDKRAQALKKFLEAQRLEQAGNYPGAVAAYKEAIALDPASPDLKIALGSLYLKNRNVIDAEAQAREVLKTAPDNLEGRKLLARIYVSQAYVGAAVDKEKAHLAIKELEEVSKDNPSVMIEIGSEQVPAYAVIGELYIAVDETEKALEAFKRVSEGGSSSDKAYYRLAQLYFQKNKFREASIAARKAYDFDQKAPAYVALLAKSLLRIGRGKEAIDLYRKALDIKDSETGLEQVLTSPLIFDYAEALVFTGEYDEAIKRLDPILKRVNRESPIYLRAIEIVSDSLRRSGRREEAVSRIEEAIKGQDVSESLSLLYNLAETFEELQQFDRAVETYEEALRAIVNPDGTVGDRPQERQNAGVILRRISLAYRNLGKRDKAIETIERMRKVLGPKSPVADQLQLGVLLDEGKYKEVLEGARQAAARHPDERSFKFLEVQAVARMGDMKAAEEALQHLLKGGQEDVEVHLFLSNVQLEANQLKAAEESARKAVALDPDDVAPLVTLSTVQERQRKYKDSEATLRKAIEIDPDNATLLNNLGYFLADHNERLSEAEDLIRRAVNIEPTNGSFLDSLGWLLFRQGKLEEAEKYLEQAIIYSPRSVTIHDHLGDVYKKLGKAEKAKAEWSTALKLGTELGFSTDPDEVARIKQKLGMK